MTGWLHASIGTGGMVLAVALQPTLLVPILVTSATLGGLPLLLITALAMIAIYSPHQARRAAAEKILDRLLTTLRPESVTRAPRGRRKTSGSGTRRPSVVGTKNETPHTRMR